MCELCFFWDQFKVNVLELTMAACTAKMPVSRQDIRWLKVNQDPLPPDNWYLFWCTW